MRAMRVQRRQPARARIGTPVGRETSRRIQVYQRLPIGSPILTRTLSASAVTEIPQGDEPQQRSRDLVNFRGVHICMDVINATSPQIPLYFNYALVNPKNNLGIDERLFFRSNASNRALPFADPNLTGLDYWCRALNNEPRSISNN